MASKKVKRREWTQRVDDIATLLFRTPATAEHIQCVSQTWPQPFRSADRTYHRLRELCEAGWVVRSPLAIASQAGAKHYYQLTLDGYRMWRRDPLALAPTKRFFAPKGNALHQHLLAKAQFLSHLTIVAHRRGFRIENDMPENTLPIRVGDSTIFPDHYLELVGPYGRRFPLYFEFDRSTESITSAVKQQDTWTQKNTVYDAYQTLHPVERFRVVPVATKSRERLGNILQRFAEQTINPDRQLYVGVYLEDFLAKDDALVHPIFSDHQRPHVPLIAPVAMNFISCQSQTCPNCLKPLRFGTNICPCVAGRIMESREHYCSASPLLTS